MVKAIERSYGYHLINHENHANSKLLGLFSLGNWNCGWLAKKMYFLFSKCDRPH